MGLKLFIVKFNTLLSYLYVLAASELLLSFVDSKCKPCYPLILRQSTKGWRSETRKTQPLTRIILKVFNSKTIILHSNKVKVSLSIMQASFPLHVPQNKMLGYLQGVGNGSSLKAKWVVLPSMWIFLVPLYSFTVNTLFQYN